MSRRVFYAMPRRDDAFTLPMRLTTITDTNLGTLFDKLVNMKESLGVREWGLSQATLEEAFIRICEEAGTK